jgi:AcrR family transcriptional regulator
MPGNVKQAYHHDDLRNALIAEALAMLSETGAAKITLRELARRLGVTHTAPYAHFADKNALFESVASAGFERLANALEAARDSTPPDLALVAMGTAYVRFARDNVNLYVLMFAGQELACDRVEMDIEGDRAFDILIDTMTQRFADSGLDIEKLGIGFWSLVHGISMLEIGGRLEGKTTRTSEEVLAEMMRLVMGNVAGPAALAADAVRQ